MPRAGAVLGLLGLAIMVTDAVKCPSPPQVDGKSVDQLIQNTPGALLLAIPNMRCTNAIKSSLKEHHIQYTEKVIPGQFKFSQNDAVWSWLHCTFSDDQAAGMTMHSYFFYHGKFIGQGFAAAQKVNQSPSNFKSTNEQMIETKSTNEQMIETAWTESIAEDTDLAEVESTDCSTVQNAESFVNQYNHIFTTGNRNAASHLWSSYLLDRSTCLTEANFKALNKAFCAISGSPLGGPDPGMSCYTASHPLASGGSSVSGQEHHCCAPCWCDAKDWTAIDTKTVSLKGGSSKEFKFFVIGDPCTNGNSDPFDADLKKNAPELKCVNGKLKGATMSDNGHVIIGMFFAAGDDSNCKYGESKHQTLQQMCTKRAASGTKSGMGEIFIELAKINPVKSQSAPSPPPPPPPHHHH